MCYKESLDLGQQIGSMVAAKAFQRNQPDSVPNNYAVSIAIYSSRIESLPRIGRVGDIILLHRCNIGQYQSNGRQYKTFFVNIDYGSAWMLFQGALTLDEPEEETNEAAKQFELPTLTPYACSR